MLTGRSSVAMLVGCAGSAQDPGAEATGKYTPAMYYSIVFRPKSGVSWAVNGVPG